MSTDERRLTVDARALAGAPDPGPAFFTFAARLTDEHPDRAALSDPDLRKAFTVLLTRAQEAGAVRTDVAPDDVAALLDGAAAARRHAASDRALTLVLDGLRR